MDDIVKVRKIIEQKLYYAILPLRVWNRLFLCVRSQYESNMCLLKHFPSQLSYGIVSGGCVNLFVHSFVIDRQKMFDESANFGTLFYEVVVEILSRCSG